MKRHSLLWAIAFLFAATQAGIAQVCSTGSYQLFQDDKSVSGACTVTTFGTFVNVTETQGYNIKCTTTSGNSNPGNAYFSDTLKLTGNGQRFCGSLISAPIFCDPVFSFNLTQAASVSDFHRFTFSETDQTTGGAQCNPGATQTLFRQCAGQPCDGTSGGGGGGGPVEEYDPGTSPIIIDSQAEGFHLTSAPDGVTFDITGTGNPIQIAWTDARFHNAFLALPGPDGLVHNGKQLFGNFTPQPASPHPNGFLALSEFDKPESGGNGDGVIDAKDAVYSRLRLWIDENHDGISQPDELHTLPELGVYSLALSYFESRRTDQFGNEFRYKARVDPGTQRDPLDQTASGDPGRWTYDVFLVSK